MSVRPHLGGGGGRQLVETIHVQHSLARSLVAGLKLGGPIDATVVAIVDDITWALYTQLRLSIVHEGGLQIPAK